MTADTCKDKDDQIAVLVEALEAVNKDVLWWDRSWDAPLTLPTIKMVEHAWADLPAAARERAEERERWRTAAFKAQDEWEEWVESELAGTSLYRRAMRVAKANRAALAGEKEARDG